MKLIVKLLLISSFMLYASNKNFEAFAQDIAAENPIEVSNDGNAEVIEEIEESNFEKLLKLNLDDLTPEDKLIKIEAVIEEKEYILFRGKNFEELNSNISSSFFKNDELEELYEGLEEYISKGKVIARKDDKGDKDKSKNVILDKNSDEEAKPRNYLSPSFYLSSLIFPRDEKWTIWLNNKKIRVEDGFIEPNLEMLGINNEVAVFLWEGENLEILSPNYTTELVNLQNPEKGTITDYIWDYISKDRKIFIDSINGVIKFIIKPGQSFSVHAAKIQEGNALPVQITYNPSDGSTAAANGANAEGGDLSEDEAETQRERDLLGDQF